MQTQKVNYPSKKIKVGQQIWTILVVPYNHPKLGKDNYGMCRWENYTVYVSNKLGQKKFEHIFTHELLHTMFDSIGYHDKLVQKLKSRGNEKMVDGLARVLVPFLRPQIFKIPNHIIRNKQKTRS